MVNKFSTKKTSTQSGNAQAHDVRKIKTNPNSQHLNKPYRIIPSFISNSVVKNKEGAEEGFNNTLPLERGAGGGCY